MKRLSWLLFPAAFASATVLQIPYTGGKMAGTVVISISSGGKTTPDTLSIAGATIRFYFASGVLPAVCGAKPTIVAQFLAPASAIFQTLDTSADWNGLTTFLGVGNGGAVPSIDAWEFMGASSPHRAPGFPLFSAGQTSSCAGEEYFLAPRWNRVVFMHFGSGVDYRARMSFQVKSDTSYAPTPMLQYHVLKSLTLHYVINTASNDLSGAPVSLQPPRFSRASAPPFDWRNADLYNPLGVRLRRDAGRFEPALPARPRER
jgi:hypothetical protein